MAQDANFTKLNQQIQNMAAQLEFFRSSNRIDEATCAILTSFTSSIQKTATTIEGEVQVLEECFAISTQIIETES